MPVSDFGPMGVNQGFDNKMRTEVVVFDTNNAASITPNAAADIGTPPSDCIYVGATGDLKVTMANGTIVTFVGIQAGIIHRLSVKRVWATGTTATNIIALYD